MLRQEYIPAPEETRQASAGSIPYRASAGAASSPDLSPAVKQGAAIGAGIGIALLGAFGAYQFYKHDQMPAAIVTGVAALALGPRLASAII